MPEFVVISDTHNLHDEVAVPDGNALIHCGDATVRGTQKELTDFADWMEAQPHHTKLFVPGNHDILMEDDASAGLDIFKKRGILVAVEAFLQIEGVPVLCNSHTPGSYPSWKRWRFHYDVDTESMDYMLRDYPTAKLLVTHGPPLGILDRTSSKYGMLDVGCPFLASEVMEAISNPDSQLQYHVFGHIHDSHGRRSLSTDRRYVTFVNAAICNDLYYPVFPPEVIIIGDG